MAEPFIGEIKMVGFNFAPRGWALCNGQLLPINQNQALYSILGTTYGGDGRTTFGLPDLRGRTPVHPDSSLSLGSRTGQENHVLTASELPAHNHRVRATNSSGNQLSPAGTTIAASAGGVPQFGFERSNSMGVFDESVGGGEAHNNMQPYLAINFAIALVGLFPSRS